jgi:hypothetical protein
MTGAARIGVSLRRRVEDSEGASAGDWSCGNIVTMDEKRASYSLKAPGSRGSGYALHMPGRGSFPRVDDHLVVPEVTRDEMISGRRVTASPAHPPHATRHHDLDYVIRAHVAPGYQGATDLLTRHDEDSDFATDVCVYKVGIDPETGARYLEEIAFEVVSEQNQGLVNEKARLMSRRGVRRIFTIWVKRGQVCEWSPGTQSWRPLSLEERIEDVCLVKPLAVGALLDAAMAENAVAEALDTKDNTVIRQLKATAQGQGREEGRLQGREEGRLQGREEGRLQGWEEGRLQGRAEGVAEAILKILEARGLPVSAAQKDEILRCHDLGRLDRWLSRAALVSSAEEVISEP